MRKKLSVTNQFDLHSRKSSGKWKHVAQLVIDLVRTTGVVIRGILKGKGKTLKFRFSEKILDEEGKVRRQKEIEIDYNRRE